MRRKPIKIVITGLLFLVIFLGEIALTFSYEQESSSNYIGPGSVPLSFKLSNSISNIQGIEHFDSMVVSFMENNDIVGASVAVTRHGRLVYTKGYGFSDQELADPVIPRNLFRIASVSKLITAVAIMKLVEDEKLKVDQPVFGPNGILNQEQYRTYSDQRFEQITLYQLLNHTAGWNGKKGDPVLNSLEVAKELGVAAPATMDHILTYTLEHPLDYAPGTTYSYSNLGYCILGRVIEEVTGMRYEDYVQFAILHPLGIYDMHIGKSFYDERLSNEVRYYELEDNALVWSYNGSGDKVPPEYGGNNVELLGAAGGWVASAPELAKLMVAIDGFDSRPDILSRSTIDFMTNTRRHTQKLIGWRGGDGYGTWWRTGTLTGTTALIMRHADETNWVVLLNTTNEHRKRIHNELSRVMFSALRSVNEWPNYDLFNYTDDQSLALH